MVSKTATLQHFCVHLWTLMNYEINVNQFLDQFNMGRHGSNYGLCGEDHVQFEDYQTKLHETQKNK